MTQSSLWLNAFSTRNLRSSSVDIFPEDNARRDEIRHRSPPPHCEKIRDVPSPSFSPTDNPSVHKFLIYSSRQEESFPFELT